MIDESGEIKIKEERDMTAVNLSGNNQRIPTEVYIKTFSEFINSENVALLARSLFCDYPDKGYLELTPDERVEFIHKLGYCADVLRVYQQSAAKHHEDTLNSLELDERIRLKKKDQAYQSKPALIDSARRETQTKQEKFVKMLRDTGMSEEKILEIVHGGKK
jgi:hypothetical protein